MYFIKFLMAVKFSNVKMSSTCEKTNRTTEDPTVAKITYRRRLSDELRRNLVYRIRKPFLIIYVTNIKKYCIPKSQAYF